MKKKLHFVGPVLTASGYGVHSRQLLRSLVDCGRFDITVESLRWGDTGFLTDPELDWIRKLADRPAHRSPDVCVQVSIANEFKRRAPLMIGVTAGIEVDRVSPQWLLKCNSEVDLVVVPSEHSRRSFLVEYASQHGDRLALEKPIFVVPEGVDTSAYKSEPSRSKVLDDVGVSNKNLICVGLGFDKPRGGDRKNMTTLVEWFCETFAGNKEVGLVLKAGIVNSSTLDFEVLKRRIADIKESTGCGEFPKIHLVHGRLSEREMSSMYNDPRIVAMVSLTHGEGFGLPLIEAAACGLPVMATDWSGHLDFLTKSGKKLFVPIEYELKDVPPECVWEGVIEAGSQWAYPKESDARIKMQKMIVSSSTPRQWASELAEHVRKTFSLDATGKVFSDLVCRACDEAALVRPTRREDFIKALKTKVSSGGPSLVYTMPMSAGDVFLSTGVVSALRRKHPGHRVFFATSPQYFQIVEGAMYGSQRLVDELIEWQPWMQDVSLLEDVFDEVYTPNLAVQMTWSNWVHKGRGRNLIDEFAVQCGVKADPPPILMRGTSDLGEGPWVAVHAGGQKSARNYARWADIVKNLRANGIKVVQVGAKDDVSIGEVDRDLRGKTTHQELVRYLDDAGVFVGIDSYPMHIASAVGCSVVSIFGSSYPSSTGPKNFALENVTDANLLVSKENVARATSRLKLIETPSRNGCDRACYKDVCRVDASNPCLNNIPPQRIFEEISKALDRQDMQWTDFRPKIAGYTHIYNPKTHGYPYFQSITSMLGFCDEVIVIDGGSTDGSIEQLESIGHEFIESGKLKIIKREWDHEEPAMDGMQKAFGRAMVSPEMEFLWQQDADEVVHEDDYEKIVDLCRRFPSDVDLIHLPVIELWGDDRTCRTDRHSWKWRLSRNNIRITHGINQAARLMDPKTGRFYAKPGMSDGCEYIDMVTGQHLPHKGFYTAELEEIRKHDPEEYGRRMNVIFDKLPSVWHYSWADLKRKVQSFRDFWDSQWATLYQTTVVPRFDPSKSVDEIADELRVRGGEHEQSTTFKLEKSPPKVMR